MSSIQNGGIFPATNQLAGIRFRSYDEFKVGNTSLKEPIILSKYYSLKKRQKLYSTCGRTPLTEAVFVRLSLSVVQRLRTCTILFPVIPPLRFEFSAFLACEAIGASCTHLSLCLIYFTLYIWQISQVFENRLSIVCLLLYFTPYDNMLPLSDFKNLNCFLYNTSPGQKLPLSYFIYFPLYQTSLSCPTVEISFYQCRDADILVLPF